MPAALIMGAVPSSACPNLTTKRLALVPQDLSCLQMAHVVNNMSPMQLSPPMSTSVASTSTAPTTQRRWCLLVDVCGMICVIFSIYRILVIRDIRRFFKCSILFFFYIFFCDSFLQHLILSRARWTFIFNLALCITLTTALLLHTRASTGVKQAADTPRG